MNRYVTGGCLVAGIALAVGWFWPKPPARQAEPGTEPDLPSLTEKLNSIIIPEYPAADVTLEEAIEHLRVKGRDHDLSTTELANKGINIVIITGGDRKLPAAAGLQLRDVPLGEALRHVTSLVDLKYTIERHAVTVRDPQDTRTPDYKKTSPLQQRLEKRIRPLVSFQNASLEEAVEYLRVSQGCLDITEAPVINVPLNFVLHVREAVKRPPLSLELRDIPMSEALRYCAEISNARLRYDTSAVMITDQKADVPESAWPARPPGSPILRAVELQDVTLAEALDFIRLKSRELTPDHRETSVVVKSAAPSPPISLSLRHISIHETLRYIAELSGHTLSLDGQGYVLTPSEAR